MVALPQRGRGLTREDRLLKKGSVFVFIEEIFCLSRIDII